MVCNLEMKLYVLTRGCGNVFEYVEIAFWRSNKEVFGRSQNHTKVWSETEPLETELEGGSR